VSVVKNDTVYWVTDPLKGGERPVETEEKGALEYGANGSFTVKDRQTAQELKQRYPWMIVAPTTDGAAVWGSSMFTMPSHWEGFENAGCELVIVDGHWEAKKQVDNAD